MNLKKKQKKILEDEIQLKQTYNELHKAITKYDKLLSDSVLYPVIIGNLCKFINFYEFINYISEKYHLNHIYTNIFHFLF